MRHLIAGVIGLATGVVAYPFVRYSTQWLGGNHYPGTAQQAGAVAMLAMGKQIAIAPYAYHEQYGRWPESLTEVINEGLLTKDQLRSYPKRADLPDRRDMKRTDEFEDWVYIKPAEGTPVGPMVIAPRPFTSSMGKVLRRPRRIVAYSDSSAEIVDDDTLTPILRQYTGN